MTKIEDNKLPLFNDNTYLHMISTQSEIKSVSKALPFDLTKYSIVSRESDCFPSCCSMAALYWKQQISKINIETSFDYWKKFRKKTTFLNINGVSLKGIYTNISLKSIKNINEIDTNNVPLIEVSDNNDPSIRCLYYIKMN
ncbi:MAG: hypothetical protein GF317_07940 [Candidatus Lokiarchaeota archaeon]|nr:hypothetical protein [Candidatus Lokiarchaeota archaeon]MBD3199643.1 hypothetical protein [Candidatus Lokiarchaeota archaeon]